VRMTSPPTWPFRSGKLSRPMRWQQPFLTKALERDRIVLSAPTGSGKTAAAIAPFLAGRSGGFADRCLYALPMRTLARSLFEEYAPELEAHGIEATLQMGGGSNDPDYRGDIVFTTIDQLLSRYLNVPYGGRPANISAGALVGAHIVLDEFHLYPEDEARLTAITMLDHLRGLSSAVVMTATLPDAARAELAAVLEAADFSVSTDDMESSGDRPRPLRSWEWREEALTAGTAIARWERAGRPKRVLVCANTVAAAQNLFRRLRAKLPERSRTILVHARFLPRDRDRHEMTARAWLGRPADEEHSWVIATQAIEAGLDASADMLLTELAPASSLVQRAGRCARWARANETAVRGSVVVFRDPDARSFRPYPRALVDATWGARRDVPNDQGANFERGLVTTVHGVADHDAMIRLRGRLPSRREEVFAAIDCPDPSSRWRLVRDISSQSVLVREGTNDIDLARLPETVPVAERSLWPLLSDREVLVTSRIPARLDDAEKMMTDEVCWLSPATKTDALAAPLLVLHPRHASYDSEIGLTLRDPGTATPLHYTGSVASIRKRFAYRKDTFEEHIGRCVLRARDFLARSQAAIVRLSNALDVPAGDIEACTLLAVALHDTGKLSEPWQRWATVHQRVLHGEVVTRCIAHTTYDPSDPAQRAKARSVRPVRPPHAVEGAVLAREIVRRWIDDRRRDDVPAAAIERSVLAAIARHHSPRATKAEPCQVDRRGQECIFRALRCADQDPSLASELAQRVARVDADLMADGLLPATRHSGGPIEVLLYAAVARVVRLADQHSFDPIRPPEVHP
jgi:CRISPR-associated endonuclease/helicase Cas3